MTTREFNGILRPRITYLGRELCPVMNIDRLIMEDQDITAERNEVLKDLFKIEWINDDNVNEVIWTEVIRCLPGISFVPQIQGNGHFVPTGVIYVDPQNHRHRVMNCESGVFGTAFHRPDKE